MLFRSVVEVALPIRFISGSASASTNDAMIDVVDEDFETSTEAPGASSAGTSTANGAAVADRSVDSGITGPDAQFREADRRTKGDRDKVDA